MRPSLNLEEFLHLLYDKFYKLQQHTSETSKFSLSFFYDHCHSFVNSLKKRKKNTQTHAHAITLATHLVRELWVHIRGPLHLGGRQVALGMGDNTRHICHQTPCK